MLTSLDAAFPVVGRPPEGDLRMVLPVPLQATGVLMVKVRGVWTRIDLELPGPRVQPLL